MKPACIVTALVSEAACIHRPLPEPGTAVQVDENFLLIISGMGAQRARLAATRAIDAGAGALLSFGFAGALADELVPGDVLVPGEIIDGPERLATDAAWLRAARSRIAGLGITLHDGAVACTNAILHEPAEKRGLRERTGAAAVDMESAAIVRVATERGVPALVVRSVLDTSVMSLPPAILRCTDDYGRTRLAELADTVRRRIALLPSVIEIGFAFRRASRSLRRMGVERSALQMET